MKGLFNSTVIVASLLFATNTYGQQTTEVYIPIGKSPGVSATKSIIGTISATDYDAHQTTITANGVSTTVTMTDKTLYYLDRNQVKQTNSMGSFNDCEEGRRVEVKTDTDGNVEWIKIAMP